MTTKSLTPQQMADILFQRPGRLTEGVLAQRSLREKARDRFLTYTDKRHSRSPNSGFEKLRGRLLLEFNECAPVESEHPRSMKKALLELKALGFSNEQVTKIKGYTYSFMTYTSTYHDLQEEIQKEHPRPLLGNCDDAFLGMAALDGTAALEHPRSVEALDKYTAASKNPKNNKNSQFSARAEELAYPLFVKSMERIQELHPDLFIPAKSLKGTDYRPIGFWP